MRDNGIQQRFSESNFQFGLKDENFINYEKDNTEKLEEDKKIIPNGKNGEHSIDELRRSQSIAVDIESSPERGLPDGTVAHPFHPGNIRKGDDHRVQSLRQQAIVQGPHQILNCFDVPILHER